jgi:hypothetical protein
VHGVHSNGDVRQRLPPRVPRFDPRDLHRKRGNAAADGRRSTFGSRSQRSAKSRARGDSVEVAHLALERDPLARVGEIADKTITGVRRAVKAAAAACYSQPARTTFPRRALLSLGAGRVYGGAAAPRCPLSHTLSAIPAERMRSGPRRRLS